MLRKINVSKTTWMATGRTKICTARQILDVLFLTFTFIIT